MRSPLRLLAMTLVITLAAAGSAQAVIQDLPQFSFSPFTKAQTGAGNAVSTTLVWLPSTFVSPGGSPDRQEVTVTDLGGGSPTTFVAGPTANSFPLLLSDGHQYAIRVAACQTPTCVPGSIFTFEATGTTRIDATPPSGTVQINDGAAATNNRSVILNLEASDPLIGGVAGTSSGITQSATDVDGNGTFPCEFILLPPGSPPPDTSGCAGAFNPATPATLPAGDGVKTVGVKFGDGARPNAAPCPPRIICAFLLGSPILGNESAVATDTILLDTVKPVAALTQDRTTVDRGGVVSFDATGSTDQSSGIDLPTATWQWKDGTPTTTGAKVSHVFNQAGTFVGELRVKDRAGNVSDARSFTVTVSGGPGGTAGGSIGGITGTAAFKLNTLKVKARYVRSRLKGSITISGSSTRAGALRAELRRTARGRVLAKIVAKKLKVGAFTRTLKLPASLLPGTYRLAFIGPGGTLRTTLKLAAPREGVVKRGRVVVSRGRATALFTLAAQPAKALRRRLTVSWSQGSRKLGRVSVSSGALIRAALPGGASLASGRLQAVLRAGGVVVGSASVAVR